MRALWIAVLVLVLIIAMAVAFLYLNGDGERLSQAQARTIASSGSCAENATIAALGAYDENTRAWLFDLTLEPTMREAGCSSVCVVREEDRSATVETQCSESPQPGTPNNEQTVSLFYYNPALDEDPSGNIMCSREGLVSVERTIPVTNTPIQDTIRLLLSGDLTEEEELQGITTEYPLPGFSLSGANLTEDGTLTLSFNDTQGRTNGGSCRIGVLWHQIEATALQFEEVEAVRFIPETLFQP